MSYALALVSVADTILASRESLHISDLRKGSRRYILVNDTFHRIQESDKHLTVFPKDPALNVAVALAWCVLHAILPRLVSSHRKLCLSIVAVAQQLEKNGWFEATASSMYKHDPDLLEYAPEAARFAAEATEEDIANGLSLMYCAKATFFHTNRHFGLQIESTLIYMQLELLFGAESADPAALAAVKSFVHWGNVKGFLFRMGVPCIKLTKEEKELYSRMTQPPDNVVAALKERFPSGTASFAFLRKSLIIIANHRFAELMPYPASPAFDPRWLFKLCDSIQENPAPYHLRAKVKDLVEAPVSLAQLQLKYSAETRALLDFIILALHTFPDPLGEHLLASSKLPDFEAASKRQNDHLLQLQTAWHRIERYESQKWAPEDIVRRLHDPSLRTVRSVLRQFCELGTNV